MVTRYSHIPKEGTARTNYNDLTWRMSTCHRILLCGGHNLSDERGLKCIARGANYTACPCLRNQMKKKSSVKESVKVTARESNYFMLHLLKVELCCHKLGDAIHGC